MSIRCPALMLRTIRILIEVEDIHLTERLAADKEDKTQDDSCFIHFSFALGRAN